MTTRDAAATTPRVPVVVLAAGAGSRYGSDDKLLVPVAGRAVLEHVLVSVTSAISATDTYVVVDPTRPARGELAAVAGAVVVASPFARRGMRWSIAAGLSALPAAAPGAVIVLGDDPLAARAIGAVLDHARRAPGAAACIDRGAAAPHPVYLPRADWPDPPTEHDDSGLRALLRDPVRIADPGAGSRDIDEPADAADVAARLRY